jgi:delta-aminolevulinic acid dehydratase/porphobilinogen synthase
MSRDVCGICWCPYDDDGHCGCAIAPSAMVWRHQAAHELLRRAVDMLKTMPVKHHQQSLHREALVKGIEEYLK